MALTIPVPLSGEEAQALDAFIAQHRPIYPQATACRLLIRDALIGLGLLALPNQNRSKGARRRR